MSRTRDPFSLPLVPETIYAFPENLPASFPEPDEPKPIPSLVLSIPAPESFASHVRAFFRAQEQNREDFLARRNQAAVQDACDEQRQLAQRAERARLEQEERERRDRWQFRKLLPGEREEWEVSSAALGFGGEDGGGIAERERERVRMAAEQMPFRRTPGALGRVPRDESGTPSSHWAVRDWNTCELCGRRNVFTVQTKRGAIACVACAMR